jgi:hypothetical protein
MKIVSHACEVRWTEHPHLVTIELLLDRTVVDGVTVKLLLKPEDAQSLIERLSSVLEKLGAERA